MRITSDGKVVSSGRGVGGLLAAWQSVAEIFTVELPRLVAALIRIAR